MTRIIDILLSLCAIIIGLPFLPIIALFIKVDSKGPVFFACQRLGQGGKIFKMYKFRTMYETPVQLGASVSPVGDPRVTPVGRVLRRLKLNEFPQFFNVLKGNMTLVGPRPEAPDLAQSYPEAFRRIFSVKPGLAGPNQILGRNEEELYPPGVDPAKYYLGEILPKKMEIDLAFIDDKSFFRDLKYLFLSVKVTILGALSRRHLLDNRGQFFMLACDALLCLLSFSMAHNIRFEGESHRDMTAVFWTVLPWTVAIRVAIFIYFGLYTILIRHLSLYDIKRVIYAAAAGSVVLVSFGFLFCGIFNYSRAVFLFDWCLLTTLLIGYRVILKKVYRRHRPGYIKSAKKRNALIWGAGDCGELCLRYLRNTGSPAYAVLGFIDEDPQKKGKQIGGVKIMGNRHHLPILAELYEIDKVFVATTSIPMPEIQEFIRNATSLNVKTELFLPIQHPAPENTFAGGPEWGSAADLRAWRSPSSV